MWPYGIPSWSFTWLACSMRIITPIPMTVVKFQESSVCKRAFHTAWHIVGAQETASNSNNALDAVSILAFLSDPHGHPWSFSLLHCLYPHCQHRYPSNHLLCCSCPSSGLITRSTGAAFWFVACSIYFASLSLPHTWAAKVVFQKHHSTSNPQGNPHLNDSGNNLSSLWWHMRPFRNWPHRPHFWPLPTSSLQAGQCHSSHEELLKTLPTGCAFPFISGAGLLSRMFCHFFSAQLLRPILIVASPRSERPSDALERGSLLPA